jgi:DNA (cytosine-5)-methyltransferase 3A
MIVLSLFDGMSCGQQALERINCKLDKYFASEIDKHAIKVTMANYPDTIQLGDVRHIDVSQLPKIDLLLGGSPCQSFSFAGKRKGMSTKDNIEILTLEHYLELKSQNFEFEGQSYLFWEYMRILNDIKQINPNALFLLENVEMGEKWEKILSLAIGFNGIHINSSLVSAQNRKRIYWTNIGMKPLGLFDDLESIIQQPKDKGIILKDILEPEVDQKYYLSEVAVNGILKHKAEQKEKGFGFGAVIKKENEKMNALKVGGKGVDDLVQIVVHNTMPRSSKTGKGGTGPLSRNDGKTYCLDTGQTNVVQIVGLTEVRTEEAKQIRRETGTNPKRAKELVERNDNKTGALLTSLTNDNLLKINNSRIRRLTPLECERLQTVKDNYTNHVSDTQRYRMLGNGWTIDVIAHILSYMET